MLLAVVPRVVGPAHIGNCCMGFLPVLAMNPTGCPWRNGTAHVGAGPARQVLLMIMPHKLPLLALPYMLLLLVLQSTLPNKLPLLGLLHAYKCTIVH
jgi:hypothetical protein